MALQAYQPLGYDVPLSQAIAKAQELGNSSKNLLAALGDYWEEYFPDSEVLNAFATGLTVLTSQQYTRLLENVLSTSVLNIPVDRPLQYSLRLFRNDQATITPDYIAFPAEDWGDVEFFTSSLIEPVAALARGTHFDIVDGELRFYVDIFNDPGIIDYTYSGDFSGIRCTLLWASNILLDGEYIYQRFGTFLYKPDNDTEAYKNLMVALQYFYSTTKSVPKIEATINILFGLPFSRIPGETVTSIDVVDLNFNPVGGVAIQGSTGDYYYRVTTDRAVYYAPFFAELLVTEGQVLSDFDLIARFHKVDDYITNPSWYDGARVPYELFESFTDPSYLGEFSEGGEFEDYVPYTQQKYDHRAKYDGTRLYVGPSGIDVTGGQFTTAVAGKQHPLMRVRLRSSYTTGWKKRLYDLVDNLLKYNMVYFNTQLNFDNYDYYKSKMGNLSEVIQSGFPVYLYPLIDVVFKAEFLDVAAAAEEHAAVATFGNDSDKYIYGDLSIPGGDTLYNKMLRYDGSAIFGGAGGETVLGGRVLTTEQYVFTPATESYRARYDGSFGFTGEIKYTPTHTVTASEFWTEQILTTFLADNLTAASEISDLIIYNAAGNVIYNGSM